MSTRSTSSLRALILVLTLIVLLCLIACSKKAGPTAATETPQQPTTAAAPVSPPDDLPAPSGDVKLPTAFGRRTGDLDEMAKSRNIRALVLLNPISFFYDKGHPKGITYEALEEFQKFANQKLKTGTLDVKVTFIALLVHRSGA